jgi:cyclophilin family peptidyl-prolyl cis-trans isomerase
MSVLLETSLGDLVIDLEVDACPKLSENFLKLCKTYYYNLNAFFNGMQFSVCFTPHFAHTRLMTVSSI